MKKILIILVILSFLGCKKNSVYYTTTSNGDSVLNCRIDRVKKNRTIKLSELIYSCSIVKLSSENNALLRDIWQVNVSENYIGIRSRGEHKMPYKLYDSSGKFLRNIGEVGNGPFEYITLANSIIDEKRERIYLAPFGEVNSIYSYDFLGESKKTIPLAFALRKPKMYLLKNQLVCFSMPFIGDESIAYVQDLNGNLIQHVPPIENWLSENYDTEVFSYFNSDKFDYYNTSIDTLQYYNLEDNKLQAVYTANYKNKRIPVPHSSFELPSYYVTWVAGKGYIFVSKHLQEASYVDIVNDFFGNIPVRLHYSNNGYFVDVYSAFSLKKQIENISHNDGISNNIKRKMQELNDSIDEYDNYILFIGQFK